MEKKIEVEIDGKKFRILEHMLDDASMFGASVIKRQVREIPKELLKIPEKKVLLPEPNLKMPGDPLPDMVISKERKKPVRSKAK